MSNENQLQSLQQKITASISLADYKKALQLTEDAITLDPKNVYFLNQKANLQKKLGNDKAAEKTLLHTIKVNQNYAGSYNNLGLLYYLQANHQQAEKLFQQALGKQPDFYDAMYNLALCYKAQDKIIDATASLNSILSIKPGHLPAHFLLARMLLAKGENDNAYQRFVMIADVTDNDKDILLEIISLLLESDRYLEAENFCNIALTKTPNNFQLLYNLAVIAERKHDLHAAKHYYQQALEVNPESFEALNNLGVIYLETQQIETAKFYLSKAAKLQPENKPLQHTLGAISGDQSIQQASHEYIASLFDQYADNFEDHLTISLEYQVPPLLKQLLQEKVKPANDSLDILDIGCGTGLATEKIKPWAKSLTGVDLSQKMLSIANSKMLFDTTHAGDNLEFLEAHPNQFDLVIAADVFVYTGNLQPLFNSIHRALRNGGWFCFSTELSDGEAYMLSQSGRFHHSYHYITEISKIAHFDLIDFRQVQTRTQHNTPVIGGIYLTKAVK